MENCALPPCMARHDNGAHCALVDEHRGFHRALVWAGPQHPVLIAFSPTTE